MQYDSCVETQSLYIHWPFCPYKCHFCPFVALASHDQFMERYHDALKKEMVHFFDLSTKKMSLETIYCGGGTPSTYPDHLLLDMFDTLSKRCLVDTRTEITIEVNPGTVRIEQLQLWQTIGVNRLSIGVQSLNDAVLRKLNRHQTVDDVHYVINHASKSFTNLSIDLILGLPEISTEEWKTIINTVIQWPITHLSVYFLTVHEDTPLFFKIKKRIIDLPADDGLVDLYHWTCDVLSQHGFERYELSNFARKGYESRHNSAYWNYVPYKGFGLGACSFDGTRRFQNEKNLMKYIEGVEHGIDVTCFSEELTQEQKYMELLMLNLRRSCGISWHMLLHNMCYEAQDRIKKTVFWLKDQALVQEQQGKLFLTSAGLVVENDVVLRLVNSAYNVQ